MNLFCLKPKLKEEKAIYKAPWIWKWTWTSGSIKGVTKHSTKETETASCWKAVTVCSNSSTKNWSRKCQLLLVYEIEKMVTEKHVVFTTQQSWLSQSEKDMWVINKLPRSCTLTATHDPVENRQMVGGLLTKMQVSVNSQAEESGVCESSWTTMLTFNSKSEL